MLAVGPFGLGMPELIIIVVILVLLFGATRVVDLFGALGKGVREFRKNVKEPEASEAPAQAAGPPSCRNCGAQLDPATKFCAQCGAPTQAAVK